MKAGELLKLLAAVDPEMPVFVPWYENNFGHAAMVESEHHFVDPYADGARWTGPIVVPDRDSQDREDIEDMVAGKIEAKSLGRALVIHPAGQPFNPGFLVACSGCGSCMHESEGGTLCSQCLEFARQQDGDKEP